MARRIHGTQGSPQITRRLTRVPFGAARALMRGKPLAILGFVGAALAVWWFASTGAAMGPLFVALFVCSFFCLGNVALITGPIATESAPPGLVSSAIGIVVGAGEIFGGGAAPYIAGGIADAFGLPSVLNVALVGVVLGIFVSFLLRETAPSKAVGQVA